MQDRFLRIAEVQKITGLSKGTLWRQERAGRFPKRRHLSQHAVGWLESEITAWVESRRPTTCAERSAQTNGSSKR